LTAVYDLQFGPVSYDFITWLARARLEQQRRAMARLHVVIVPYAQGLGGFARHWGGHDAALTDWKLWNILLPACRLAGATITLLDAEIRPPQPGPFDWWPEGKAHFLRPLVEAAKAGEPIPLLMASAQSLRWVRGWIADRRVVTLTLRANNGADGRDSNLTAWKGFAAWLSSHGWMPVVLNDSGVALQRETGHFAELSTDLRLALYQGAAMNCFCNNGPMTLAWHSTAPYLSFCAGLPSDRWAAHWSRHLALETGDQLPWSGPEQRLIYRPDAIDVLVEEFERWSSR
jgi:hypothetical protein